MMYIPLQTIFVILLRSTYCLPPNYLLQRQKTIIFCLFPLCLLVRLIEIGTPWSLDRRWGKCYLLCPKQCSWKTLESGFCLCYYYNHHRKEGIMTTCPSNKLQFKYHEYLEQNLIVITLNFEIPTLQTPPVCGWGNEMHRHRAPYYFKLFYKIKIEIECVLLDTWIATNYFTSMM